MPLDGNSGISLELDFACALDPVVFAVERLGFHADDWQAGLLRSEEKQICENAARQTGKSSVTAIKALHTGLYDPVSLILLISPSLRQSRELFGKIMNFLKDLEPAEVLAEDNRSSCTLQNRSRIVSLPGDPDTVRGFSAPRLVIADEASRIPDAVYTAIRPMLATGGGQLILLSTPNGRRGYFHECWHHGQGWQRFKVAAAECPRISPAHLEAEMHELGPMLYSQEYECQFIDADTAAFSSVLIENALCDDIEELVL